MHKIEETAAGIGAALIVLGCSTLIWLAFRGFVKAGLAQVWWPL